MSEEPCELILHTGDIIYPAGELMNYDPNFFVPYGSMLRRAPIFPAIGNHDLITLGIPFETIFTLPANNPQGTEFYYSFDYGDARFIALDTTIFGHIPVGSHMTWLQGELSSNTRRWLVVYFHIPLYSSGVHGNDVLLQFNLEAMFENAGVDLVLTGHDHNYERFRPIKKHSQDPSYKGIVHVLTGGGGKDTRSVGSQSTTAYSEECYHYTRFTVRRNQIEGQAVRLDGAIIDDFVITK
jgi:acid phosphatase type 7